MYQKIELNEIYNGIQPFLDRDSLIIHYNIYLKNLKKLNKLLQDTNYNYQYSLSELINHINIFNLNIRGEILYYLSSILNHNLFFYSLSNKNNTPSKTIEKDIIKYFNSYENFKNEFKKYAMNLKGSGYTFLVLEPNKKLKIINTSNEDSPYYYGFIPIINLDLWEHSFFLKYKDKKEEYIDNFFKVLDFEKINSYYERILKET